MSKITRKINKLALSALLILFAVAQTASADSAQYIVKHKAGKSAQAKGLVNQYGGQIKRELKRHNAMAVRMTAEKAEKLAKNPNIDFIEEDVKRYPLAQVTPYGIPMVQADLLSDSSAGTRKVCIIDSGYDLGHEDLSSNSVSGTNDSGTGNWYEDQNHHGTHVAGTIAALNNGVGVVGVLPNGNINLHIVKVFDANGWAYSSSLVAALDVCTDNNANVINMSLGGSRASRAERIAFQSAYDVGVLSIAAAGNDGNTRHSYPASYDSVVSVAAIDSNKVVADFSQQTDQVELAAPGVGVLSSIPTGSGSEAELTVANTSYEALGMDGSPLGTASGQLVDCGTGESTCAGATGQICLIQRGVISFADKVLACEAGSGAGVIIYNNEPGILSGTLGETSTSIPSVGISDTDGASLLLQLGASASVGLVPSNYAYFDGTSMATPHTAAVAALVWSHHLTCSAGEIRAALSTTAEDLGTAGRDNAYGSGLIKAADAVTYLDANPCDGSDPGDGGSGGGDPKPCRGGPKKCPS